MMTPYIEHWPQALAIKSNPLYVSTSLMNLGYLMDDIWYYAGDRSTDTNWYTKRGLLAGVYCSTELHMTQDTSQDFVETWKFMERRLKDVKDIGTNTKQILEAVNSLSAFTSVSLKTMVNALGWRIR
jgi:ubiquinone biosynthesis protein COQ9